MPLDLTLAPLYRINGQEITSLPGLIVQAPPQSAVRVRAQDRLVVYLLLTGNAVFSVSEYMQTARMQRMFLQTAGLTNACAATENVNKTYSNAICPPADGVNIPAAGLRSPYCGSAMHALNERPCMFIGLGNETRHIHEPGRLAKDWA